MHERIHLMEYFVVNEIIFKTYFRRDEIVEFITDTQDDLIEDLSELVAKKRDAEAKNRQIAKNKADAEAKQTAEKEANEAKEKEELEQKELEEKQALEEKPKTDPEKKSGIGWGGLIVGGALLILSAGAINYFGKILNNLL